MFYKMFSSCCFVWIINCCLIHFHLEVTSGGKEFVIQKTAKLLIFLYYSDSQNLFEVTIFISEILWPCNCDSVQFSSVAQSCPTLCNPMNLSTPGLLSITNSWSLLTLMSIESVMPSSHLIFCCPLLFLPSVPPSIRVFFQWVNSSNEVAKVLEFQLQHQSFQWTPR